MDYHRWKSKNTIIDGQLSGQSIFSISTGFNVNIINLTFINGNNTISSAITNEGALKIDNTSFRDNILKHPVVLLSIM
jgi:hypothetical protein